MLGQPDLSLADHQGAVGRLKVLERGAHKLGCHLPHALFVILDLQRVASGLAEVTGIGDVQERGSADPG